MTLNIVIKCNWVTGSPPKFDTLLAVWYRTYMQSFIISHSSCAEQYGDMSPDTHTHTIKFIKFNWVTTKIWHIVGSMVPDIHAKFHNQPFIMRRAILMILPEHTHGRTHERTHARTNERTHARTHTHTQLKCYSWLSNKLAIPVYNINM